MKRARLSVCGLLVLTMICGTGCATVRVGPRAAGIRVLEGKGSGLPAADAKTPDQQRMTACRAAYYGALADLAGKVYGTKLEQESKVINMQFAGETVHAGVSGLLEGVEVVSNEYDPQQGMATAVVRVGLDREGRVVPAALLPRAAPEKKK